MNLEDPTSINFETAFGRLEEILEKLNASTISLDDSITLYEEADQLMAICNKRLQDAERKIEILVKNRNGELVLGDEEQPIKQDYKSI